MVQPDPKWKEFYDQAASIEKESPDEAVRLYNQALQLDNDATLVLHALGKLLQKLGKNDASLVCACRVAAREPEKVEHHIRLGEAFTECGRHEEAADAYRKAGELRTDDVEILFKQGLALLEAGRHAEMLKPMQRAQQLEPGHRKAGFGVAMSLLSTGNFAAGWKAFEIRRKFPEAMIEEPYPEKRWRGQPIDGKLLVGSEQGIGDMIQFIRFIRHARKLCGRLVLQAPDNVRELFATAEGVDAVIPTKPFPTEFQAYIPMLSLPGALAQDVSLHRVEVPYLKVPKQKMTWAQELLQPLRKQFRIGIVWAGNPNYIRDQSRSIPFEFFLDLFEVPNIALVSLQYGERNKDMKASKVGALIHDLGKHLNTFSETAAIVSQLDLVISCDSAVAHLAGALGKPVWVLTEHNVSWRWIEQPHAPTWYPTTRVFRQTPEKNWDEVMRRVVCALKALVQDGNSDS